MYSFFDYQFWFFAILFIPVIAVSFFIPGFFILKKFPTFAIIPSFVTAVVLGVVSWAAQGYIFGYLGLRFMTYGYVLASLIWGWSHRNEIRKFALHFAKEIKKLDKVILLIIFIGLLLQVIPMMASGMRFSDGIRFYFVNEADGIMHLSYIESIIRSFPPQEPGAVGLPLINYHYWSDLVIAELSRTFMLPIAHLFFQFIPPLLSVLTGLIVYALIKTWGGSALVARFALFFLYFSGDSAYLVYYILHQSLYFNTPAIDNGVTQFFNMPHVFAKMIFLTGLIPLQFWLTTKKKTWGILTVFLFAPLVGFKVYYGLFAAFGFSLIVLSKYIETLIKLMRKRNGIQSFTRAIILNGANILLLLLFAAIASLIYFPPNSGSGGLFYSPLEWPKLLLGAQSLDFEGWWLRLQVYEAAGNMKAVIFYDVVAIAIAVISIHGTRALGFIPTKTLYKNLRWEGMLFYYPGIILFTLLGFFTLQESGLFNVFNFFVVTLVILPLFASFSLANLIKKRSVWGKALVLILILLTVPRVIHETNSFMSSYRTNKYRLISNDELSALTYLKDQTPRDSIVQSHPDNSLDSTTPYVSFFSNRQTYFTGGGLLATHNQPVKRRAEVLNNIFSEPNVTEFASSLRANNIRYVYLLKKDKKLPFGQEPPHLTAVYENNEVIIYQVFKGE